MPRSGQEPQQIELRTVRDDKLHIKVRWDITSEEVTDETINETRTEWVYQEELVKPPAPDVPESKYQDWVSSNKEGLKLAAKAKANDLTTTEQKRIIDIETGKRIDNRVHEASGLEEQIGILRYAITELYNRLGENIPTELETLNTIANEEIQNGQDKKSDL